MDKIDQILEKWKAEVLSEFCNRCTAPCCESNLTGITRMQVILIAGDDFASIKNGIDKPTYLLQDDGTYITDYSFGEACPQLEEGTCQIYDHEAKPNQCRSYPFHRRGNDVHVMNYPCPATGMVSDIAYLCRDVEKAGGSMHFVYGLQKGRIPRDLIDMEIQKLDQMEKFRNRPRPTVH